MKVLFVAYYFEPYEGVGAKRVSYWAKNISLLDPKIICDVVTATDNVGTNEFINKIHFVPDARKGILSKIIKFDQGITWKNDLNIFFKNNPTIYDFIIFTGGPFLHFETAKYIKNNHTKIIFDFRDPFANDPRLDIPKLKLIVKKYLEKKFINYADYLITVNNQCANLIQSQSKKIFLIDNGYNETIVDKVDKIEFNNQKINFIYAGTLHPDRNPSVFLSTLKDTILSENVMIHFVGNETAFLKSIEHESFITLYGKKSYEETIGFIKGSDIGLIFTSGVAHESTTKIYDYLSCDKKVLIITDGECYSGALYDITENIVGVQWCQNNPHAILESIEILIKTEKPSYNSLDYSRKNGLLKLINILSKEVI